MRESKDLNKLELHDLFANLKAYEFELETRAESEPSTSQPTRALSAVTPEQCSTSKSVEELSSLVVDCGKPKLDTKKQPDRGNSNDKKDKKSYRKRKTEKAMVAKENKSAWADKGCET
ncbi:hypothetical protein F511_34718 [Dorcoceras hygrometricum]|uniref:Uncharacterized protein n=1 Tax=Dorcoceras hygrometricum TaxID=472368 RepID=A0A2Z7BLZ6_9LAMI|nr:hypothetical protein F511_34718 [Dorcoceras hygrometricum]